MTGDPRATGVGGVFFRSADPEALYRWYEQHLGLRRDGDTAVVLRWADDRSSGSTVFAIFPLDTGYFGRSGQPFMVNLRVHDLDGLLARLAADGVEIDPRREDFPYGRFAWIVDPDGNRVELWEPPASG
jgi:catechol 2,3-dioxygenase-like lactoylglutathione lyase family enzyme